MTLLGPGQCMADTLVHNSIYHLQMGTMVSFSRYFSANLRNPEKIPVKVGTLEFPILEALVPAARRAAVWQRELTQTEEGPRWPHDYNVLVPPRMPQCSCRHWGWWAVLRDAACA